MTEHQQYVTLLTCLSYEVARLELKLATLLRIQAKAVQLQDDSAAPLFTALAESLHVDVVISLAKLFEDRSDTRPRSLLRLLTFVDKNSEKIQWKERLTVFDSRRDRAQIGTRSAEINLVVSQRDRYFAHQGKDCSGRLEDLTCDLPVTTETLTGLLQLAQQVLAKHSIAVHGTACVSVAELAADHVDKMVAAV